MPPREPQIVVLVARGRASAAIGEQLLACAGQAAAELRRAPGLPALGAEEYGMDIFVQSFDISKVGVANARTLGAGLGDALLIDLASSAQG